MTQPPATARVGWDEIPPHVRDAVAGILGSPVVHAVSQPGGFSPGSADRVACADGRRAFVKTATAARNPEVVGIHRREAAVAAVLPPQVPAPHMIGTAGGEDWIALAFEEVDGGHAALPWQPDALLATLDAFARIGSATLDARARELLRPIAGPIADIAGGWGRILADGVLADTRHPLDTSDPDVAWACDRAARWAGDAEALVAECAGDALVHFDARHDNILIDTAGNALLIDWPWAVRGAPWFDAVLLLVDVRMQDADADVSRLLGSHRAFTGATEATVTRLLAGFAGIMLDRGRHREPPGLPTLRAFQRAQGAVACRLLRERHPA